MQHRKGKKILKKSLKTLLEKFWVGVRGVRKVRTLVGNLLKYAPQKKSHLEQFYHAVQHTKGTKKQQGGERSLPKSFLVGVRRVRTLVGAVSNGTTYVRLIKQMYSFSRLL